MPPCSCHSSLAASDEPADLWRYCQQVDRVRGGGEQDPPVGPAQWAVWFTFTPMWWGSALNTSGSLASVTETFINAPCMRVWRAKSPHRLYTGMFLARTLVDSPSLLPFLRCEHDFLAYAAPAVVTPAHKETPPRGSWNGSFHKPRQRSGGLADHGDRVSRQAVPHLWSEHVWPHIRRLLTPYSYQWIGNSPRPKYSVVRGMNISACRLPSNGISRGQKDRPHFNRGAESAKLVWTMSVRRKRIIAMEQFHGDSCIPTNESMKILFAVLNPSSMHSGDNP